MVDKQKIDVKNIPVDVHVYRPDTPAKYASRDRIYVRAVKGLHQSLRRNMGFVFMALFFVLPWLQFDGHQAILLNIVEQKFTIFGLTLWPQDFTLLAWIFIIAAYALFFCYHFLWPGMVRLFVSTIGVDLYFYVV